MNKKYREGDRVYLIKEKEIATISIVWYNNTFFIGEHNEDKNKYYSRLFSEDEFISVNKSRVNKINNLLNFFDKIK